MRRLSTPQLEKILETAFELGNHALAWKLLSKKELLEKVDAEVFKDAIFDAILYHGRGQWNYL